MKKSTIIKICLLLLCIFVTNAFSQRTYSESFELDSIKNKKTFNLEGKYEYITLFIKISGGTGVDTLLVYNITPTKDTINIGLVSLKNADFLTKIITSSTYEGYLVYSPFVYNLFIQPTKSLSSNKKIKVIINAVNYQ